VWDYVLNSKRGGKMSGLIFLENDKLFGLIDSIYNETVIVIKKLRD
jgi:hypothetical protein